MKKSNAIILSLVTFVAGVMAGLLYASYKGPPPGMGVRSDPAVMAQAAAPKNEDLEHVQARVEELKNEIKKSPDNLGLYVQAGNELFDHELFDQALTFYNQAIELGLEDPNVITDAGVCYRRVGEPKKAVEYFRRARKLDPGHKISALNLGIVLLHDLEDREGAIEAWKDYLALEPEGQRADMIRRVMSEIEKQGVPNSK